MKKQISGLVLALALMGLAPATAAAAEVNMGAKAVTAIDCETGNNRGGAAALAALVAAAVDVGGVSVCNVEVLNNSLNNLLQNADIRALNNILNNSPILNDSLDDFVVEVNALTGITTISVLGGGPLLIISPVINP